jgi:integrase
MRRKSEAVSASDVVGRRRRRRKPSSRVTRLRRADLRQLALELANVLGAKKQRKTFGELAQAWLRRVSKRRVCPANEARHIRHMRALASLREGELTKGTIEDAFGDCLSPRGPLGPASINKLRSTGRLIILDAQGNGEWTGLNPFELVAPMKPPRLIHPTLTVREVRRVLPKLRPDRRRLSKTILLVGIRPGEALGLMKVDVDLVHKMLKVRRSHGRAQTKTGKQREFPIPHELLPTLREAMAESSSEYVFPKADGTRQRADTKLAKVLRTAIKAAGIVTGYRFLCRKYSCAFEGRVFKQTSAATACPECGESMWFSGVPKHLRFYDLRHSSATLHRKAKCDPLVVREMMGHASRNQTDDTYTHLDSNYQRVELNKLKLTPSTL